MMDSLYESLVLTGADQPSKVDTENYIIYDVALLNERGKNKRFYPLEIRKVIASQMEGMPVGLAHPPKNKQNPKYLVSHKPDEILGQAFDVKVTSTGVRGNLRLLKTKEFNSTLMEAAQTMPSVFGMSTLIDGSTVDHPTEQGWKLVNKVAKCRYVDVVCEPSTTSSLFEEEEAAKPEGEGEGEGESSHPLDKHAGTLHHEILNHMDDYHPHLGGHGDHEKAIKNISASIKAYHKIHHGGGEGEYTATEESGEAKPETKSESLTVDASATSLAESTSTRKYPVRTARSAPPPLSRETWLTEEEKEKRHTQTCEQLAAFLRS